MIKHKNQLRFRLVFSSLLLLTLASVLQLGRVLNAYGVLAISRRWWIVLGLGMAIALIELVLLSITFTRWRSQFVNWLAALAAWLRRTGKWNLLAFLAVTAAYAYLLVGRWAIYFDDPALRWSVFLLSVLLASVFLWASGFNNPWWEIIGASLLFIAVGYRIALYSQDLSTSLFSLNWSETSRYYYASLFFSKRIYGFTIPPTVLHPSRYLMQALPFLLPAAPLWFHRLWQVFLWVAVTSLTSFLLTRRVSIPDRLRCWMFAGWSFLFLLLGPVYYHLQVPLIVLLLGFDRRRFWRSLGFILLASAWAGISRINWFPVPGMLASAIYFLEEPLARRPLWRYLVPPVIWTTLGTAVAFGAQVGYALWSGNPPHQFTTSFSSDLLWYRLFPNPTYPAGVIPMAALVSAPLLLLPVIHIYGRWKQMHGIRWLGLISILVVLLAGGLVVSTKIGGGSNLHNLDAYLSLLLVIASFLLLDRWAAELHENAAIASEQDTPPDPPAVEGQPPIIAPATPLSTRRSQLLKLSLAASLLMLVFITIRAGDALEPVDRTAVNLALQRLERFVDEAASEGGEILFISERQLITFGVIRGIRMVPDYEKVFLMEMAMAGDPDYLGHFWKDLENHRFTMIITEPMFTRYKGPQESFGEENDAWVKNVAEKVMCSYEAHKMLREISLQLLVPRSRPSKCP